MKKDSFSYVSLAVLACLFAFATRGVPVFAQNSNSQAKILAGYFEEWSIYYANYNLANLESNGSAAKLSHLIYAFGNVSASASNPSSDSCVIADPWADFEDNNLPPVGGIADVWPLYGNFAEILKLKQLHPGLKTVISLGGASASAAQAFSTAASTQAGRQALVASCINMFIVGNVGSDWNGNITAPGLFDGINIDWEFPAAADKENFTLLLQEFRTQLNALSAQTGKQYNLSFDGPAGSQNYTNIDLKNAANAVDFITVDGYDYAGTWESTTNDGSPLFDSRQDPFFGQGLDIEDTFSAYLKAGVPPRKYLMGVPLYGAGWTGVPNSNHGLYQTSTGPAPVLLANGTGLCTDLSGNTPGCDTLLTPGVLTYSTLSTLTSNGYTSYFDPKRIAVWLFNPATQTFYTYDDSDTAFLKSLYIDFRVPGGLGGAFVWAVKDDDSKGTMVKTLAIGLGR
ncbi:MAG TPA: glycosyl hydrolase family 18 protein [Pseudacidobacterium sp.]|jgi:chitinase|nr:glycosyl hydrolase family 18 protein [Pseudacidobacterium sp.]